MATTVLKISNDYITVIDQISSPRDLRYEEELQNIGELRFSLPINSVHLDNLTPWNKITLHEIENNVDTLVWSGVVLDPQFNFDRATIICHDERRFMTKKILFEDKSFNTSIDLVLNVLVTEANARSAGDGKGDLSKTTSLTDNVLKDFKKGDKYIDVLNEIALLLDAEWKVSLNKIIFNATIGIDRTLADDNFTEFVSNIDSPNENSILTFNQKSNGQNIVTSVLARDRAGTFEAQSSDPDGFGTLEGFTSFNDGSLPDQTTAYLDEHKIQQRELDISPRTSKFDYKLINIGDLVQVRNERNSSIIDVDESFKVIKKNVEFINQKPILKVVLGKLKTSVFNVTNALGQLNRKISQLELS